MGTGPGYSDYDEPANNWMGSFLNRILYLLIVAAALILLVCWFLPLVKERDRQQHYLQTFKQEVDQERALYNKQSKKLTLLQNDPAYTEILARDKLDLMKPGETIFRMEPAPENGQ
ncbi:MAG: septum formation initiator family protein [Verrucomicrobia bacterium]|nr:septum formation initiator family protein [Verrucomicrobiota bacterium]